MTDADGWEDCLTALLSDPAPLTGRSILDSPLVPDQDQVLHHIHITGEEKGRSSSSSARAYPARRSRARSTVSAAPKWSMVSTGRGRRSSSSSRVTSEEAEHEPI